MFAFSVSYDGSRPPFFFRISPAVVIGLFVLHRFPCEDPAILCDSLRQCLWQEKQSRYNWMDVHVIHHPNFFFIQ